MRLSTITIPVLAIAFAGPAEAQLQNTVPSGYGTSQGGAKPLHGDSSVSVPGSGGGWSDKRPNGTVSTARYEQMLASQLSEAEQLLARAQSGSPLTDSDRKHIRSAMREDFIAWRKEYDPRSSTYKAMHDRWLVDEESLSPEAWAKQRVDWLRAEQQWIAGAAG